MTMPMTAPEKEALRCKMIAELARVKKRIEIMSYCLEMARHSDFNNDFSDLGKKITGEVKVKMVLAEQNFCRLIDAPLAPAS